DIATPEAFRQALLAARSVAVSDVAVGGTAGKHLARMFEQIGVADAIDRKALRCASGADVTQCVADGQADIGMTFIREMLPILGARVVGRCRHRSGATRPMRREWPWRVASVP